MGANTSTCCVRREKEELTENELDDLKKFNLSAYQGLQVSKTASHLPLLKNVREVEDDVYGLESQMDESVVYTN